MILTGKKSVTAWVVIMVAFTSAIAILIYGFGEKTKNSALVAAITEAYPVAKYLTVPTTETTVSPGPTSPPQLLTGKVCTVADLTAQQNYYDKTGGSYVATYACMRCGGLGTAADGALSWMPTRITTSIRGNMCGASVETSRSAQDLTYFTSPLGQCYAQTKNVVATVKREVPSFTQFCPSLTAPTETDLACTVLADTIYTNWETGKKWDTTAVTPNFAVPLGSPEFYEQSKTVKQTLKEARACPAPSRKLGADACQVYATAPDVAHFTSDFFCPLGSPPPIQSRVPVSRVMPTFGFPSPQKFKPFTRPLFPGMIGEDVRQLQKFLNFQGFAITTKGPGSLGNESTYFSSLTQTALAKFQKGYGISPANGYFDSQTLAKANGIIGVPIVFDLDPIEPDDPDPPAIPRPPLVAGQVLPIPIFCPVGMTLLTSGNAIANPQSITVNVSITQDPGAVLFNYDYTGPDGEPHSGVALNLDNVIRGVQAFGSQGLNCAYLNSAQTYAPPFPIGNCAAGQVEVPNPQNPTSCTIPAGSYFSPNSQVEADAFAQAAAAAQCANLASLCYAIPLCYLIEPTNAQSFGFSVGEGATFYESRTVPHGSVCKSEYRECKLTSPSHTIPTVAMTGTYQYNQCTVDPAPPSPQSPLPATNYPPPSGSGIEYNSDAGGSDF